MSIEKALQRLRRVADYPPTVKADLLQDLRSGKLPSARRWFDPNVEVALGCERLTPAFWRNASIQTVVFNGKDCDEVRGVAVRPGCRYGYYVFRANLKQRYPFIGADSLDSAPPTAFEPGPEPPRLPSWVTVHNWGAIHAEIARRCLDPSGRLAIPQQRSLVTDMTAWCHNKFGFAPHERELREAVKTMCEGLRAAPSP